MEVKQLEDTFLDQASRVRLIPENGNARTKKAGAVHLDATKAGDVGRSGLCGLIAVQTENDVSRVTCKICLRKLRAQAQEPANENARHSAKAERRTLSAAKLVEAVVAAFRSILAKKAPSPPRLDQETWSATCKGGDRRCSAAHRCALCEWEVKVAQADHIAPWDDGARQRTRKENAPRWSSVNAALVDLANYLQHDRWSPSAMGGILARIKSAEVGGHQSMKGEDPLMRRAGDLAPVFYALHLAYPVGGSSKLTPAQGMDVLLNRTPGACPTKVDKDEPEAPVVTYEALAERYGCFVGDIQATVRHGRRVVYEELLRRGLVARQMPRRRDRAASSAVHLAEAFEEDLADVG